MYKNRSFREKRTARIHSAKNELLDSPLPIKDVQYISGGFEEFDPNKGEVMAPECVQLKLKVEDSLAIKALISRICDRYDLRVQIPDYKQTFGEPMVIRLVNDQKINL